MSPLSTARHGQRVVNLLHVPPHHHVRQAARGAQRLDVLPPRLRVPLVAERQLAIRNSSPAFAQISSIRAIGTVSAAPTCWNLLKVLFGDAGVRRGYLGDG